MRSAFNVVVVAIATFATANLIPDADTVAADVTVTDAVGCWMRAALVVVEEDTDAAAEAIFASPSA